MNHPRIGVAVLLKENNKILLGYRKSELGKNTWGLPGGKLDFGEEPIKCAIRELKEETNLNVNELKFIGFSNSVFDNETHYITLIYESNIFNGELKIMEPDKCKEWKWFDYVNFPNELFLPLKNFLLEYKIDE